MGRSVEISASASDGGAGESIAETARDHLRAVVGGLLVGLPLLWTQEVWEHGSTLDPLKILVVLALAFGIVVGFNAVSGFRRDRSWSALLLDAVEGMGLSIVVAAAALFVLGRMGAELGVGAMVGRVALEAIGVAFGTGLAATVLSDPEDGGGRGAVGPLGRLLVAAGGALYFALNVAPTGEVRTIGAEADLPLLLLAIGGSLAIGIATELTLGKGRRGWSGRKGAPLETPLGETVAAYAVALIVSVVLLWSFGLTDGLGPRAQVGTVVMLSVVATFGASAGRLLVGGKSEEAGV